MQGVNVIQAKADASVHEAEEAKFRLEQQVQILSAKLDQALQVMCLSVTEDIKSSAVQTTECERLRTENEGMQSQHMCERYRLYVGKPGTRKMSII